MSRVLALVLALSVPAMAQAQEPSEHELPTLVGEGFQGSPSWDASRFRPWLLRFEVGGGSFGLDRSLFNGEAVHGESLRGFQIEGSKVHAYGMRASAVLGVMLNQYISLGLHLSFGGGGVNAPIETGGTMSLQVNSLMIGELGTVFGVSIPFGDFVLRPEVVVGARYIELDVTSQLDESSVRSKVSTWDGLARGQLALDYFALPNGSIGVQVGYDPIHREVSGALRFSLHLRSYDGVHR